MITEEQQLIVRPLCMYLAILGERLNLEKLSDKTIERLRDEAEKAIAALAKEGK